MSFTVITETSANLPFNIIKRGKIIVVPFSYYIGGREFICTNQEEFDSSAYYNSMRNGTKVTTSQINPQRYIEYFKPVLDSGSDILFIGMSSGISGSFGSSRIAADMLSADYGGRKIRLVDSLGASFGEGILVLKAIECAEKGMSLEQTADFLDEYKKSVCQIFTVDDLMHLRRSGRISDVRAIIGSALNIKPILKGDENGKIVSYAKARGRKRAIEALAEKYREFVRNPKSQTVGISHADCLEDAEYLKKLIIKFNAPHDILVVNHEPVTGAHVGPGALALFFEGSPDARCN